ncbi:hypothetical protein MOQ73_12690 [Klebsiella pneumoniae]|uniref:hypothetical protein n=1 Tax=Klebsiella pneumoniae TaxID=573 RepID=UPI001F625B71|nr:hypothetical protein [Klebsiella pneumoniae]UNS88738.1 hypothetical protein MOQ73_12690 [Klebsiella pneumoniae]
MKTTNTTRRQCANALRARYVSPVALRLPGLRILGHLLAEGTSMPQSYRRQS